MSALAFTSSHFQASQAGLGVLQEGGTAIEAMVAAAAAISVAYPHMNGLGGDGFWLIHEPGCTPVAIDAAGRSAATATADVYLSAGLTQIPERGPKAALTVAGTVSGWQQALTISHRWQAGLPLARLLAPAEHLARQGIRVTHSLAAASRKTRAAMVDVPGFAARYLPEGQPLAVGQTLCNGPLADLLAHLGRQGLDDFYRGETADCIAASLAEAGSPLTRDDLATQQARPCEPLSVTTRQGTFYNLPLPTQGVASLLILALFDRLYDPAQSEAQQLHLLIEATKQAFRVRNAEVQDPALATEDVARWLTPAGLDRLAAGISPCQAAPWPNAARPGDTVWMAARDAQGRMVSFIQSIYWEFGAGLVIPDLGLLWNNRGVGFSLQEGAINRLAGGRQPFHTLNPALAHLHDGRVLAYGTMGGEGQPQTQAAIVWRHLYGGLPLTRAVAAPRWLLGRTWGASDHDLKLESDLSPQLVEALRQYGHQLQQVDACNELMGHAGAILADANGVLEAATDPRSDGLACIGSIHF